MASPAYGLTGANQAINDARFGNAIALGGYAGGTVPQGQQAGSLQAAYSGAMGAPAQQQAFANFTASPGQEWLRQQAEQGTLRNAAAIGGLGGGNVRQELQRQAMGLAQQDFQNQFNNLGTVADRGYQASNSLANYNTQLQGAGAGYAYGAGQDIANNRAATTSALNSLYGDYTSNLANMLTGAGGAQATSNQSLAALLANLATGSQSNYVGASQLPGVSQSAGSLGGIGNLLGGAGALATGMGWGAAGAAAAPALGAIAAPSAASLGALALGVSDVRLKTNINRVGTTAGGNALYTWDWTPEGSRLAGKQPTFGVIAQEVNQDAVVMGSDGWLRVDYTRVL
jgi:hypothetical protein